MEVLAQINQKIQDFLEELESPIVLGLSQRIQSGKMLRSKLVLNIANKSDECILLCAIIEMIQNASLLHDDVIDNATIRRSQPSINVIAGDKNAIMLGDILYSKAFCELSAFQENFPMIPRIISSAVTMLAIGEMEDVELAKQFNANEAKYLTMIEHKTASLIEATAYAAAFLSGKNQEEAKDFRVYGRNLGIAFQIIDDVLDITADEKTLGKPILSDFKEGKVTLPYIYLYHSLNEVDKKRLESAFKKELPKKEQEWILQNLKESGAIQQSIDLARHLGRVGIEAISNYSCDKLVKIMEEMINRDF